MVVARAADQLRLVGGEDAAFLGSLARSGSIAQQLAQRRRGVVHSTLSSTVTHNRHELCQEGKKLTFVV